MWTHYRTDVSTSRGRCGRFERSHCFRFSLAAYTDPEGCEGEFGRGERRQTTLRHLNVPANLPLEIEITGAERWLRSSTA
jgi:hypothetical protein